MRERRQASGSKTDAHLCTSLRLPCPRLGLQDDVVRRDGQQYVRHVRPHPPRGNAGQQGLRRALACACEIISEVAFTFNVRSASAVLFVLEGLMVRRPASTRYRALIWWGAVRQRAGRCAMVQAGHTSTFNLAVNAQQSSHRGRCAQPKCIRTHCFMPALTAVDGWKMIGQVSEVAQDAACGGTA